MNGGIASRGLMLVGVLVAMGCSGSDGKPCTLTTAADGTRTLTCPGSDPITIANGTNGMNGTAGHDGTDGTGTPGTDGMNGTNGTNGTDGNNGTSGTSCSVTDNGDGTQTVTCTDGTTAVISAPPSTHLSRFEDMPGIVLTVTGVACAGNADGTYAVGDHPCVTFTLADRAGHAVPLAALDVARIWLSGPTTNYQHVIPSTADVRTLEDVKSTSVANPDGSYTYTFSEAIPATFGVPVNDTATYTDGELTGPLTAGTYTVAMNVYKNYWIDGREVIDSGSVTHDVLFDHATTVEPREVVTSANCDQCHNDIQGHDGKLHGTNMCVTCHTSGAEDPEHHTTIDSRVLFHRIHNGAHLPSVLGIGTAADGTRTYATTGTPFLAGDGDFSDVVFPRMPNFQIAMPRNAGFSALSTAATITPAGATTQMSQQAANNFMRRGVTACYMCHGDPDGAGPLPAPAQGDTVFTAPLRRACGACHDDVDWTRPYVQNGATMPANPLETACPTCHTESSTPISVRDAHTHPLSDPAVDPNNVITITAVTGGSGTGGSFRAGDSPSVAFTIRNPAGTADVPITSYDAMTLVFTGPTTTRQQVFPGPFNPAPYDFVGRLQSPSASNKGNMSKVFPATGAVSDILTVSFTSPTAFTVTGRTSGALGAGTLAGAASAKTNGTGYAAFNNFAFSATAAAQALTVAFTDATHFTVTGATSGAMGAGVLPNSINTLTRFTSTDGSVAFDVTGPNDATRAFAAGDNVYINVFKGAAANPVLFAIVAGRTAFATGDRFYYEYTAPAATYTTRIPMDLTMERLGAADGTAQVFTAANLPVYYGRQSLFERTALVGAATTLTAANRLLATWLYVGTVDPGIAANDYVVIDAGTANEEYAQVSAVNAANKTITLVRSRGLRYAHAAGATVQEATLTLRQEGSFYTLNPTTGTITLAAASTAGNVFILNYRTDGRFGWRRGPGDTPQATYYTPPDLFEATDETWGDWRAKPYVDGTYTVALWGNTNIEYARNGEHQVYRGTATASRFDVLYGATATTITPYSLLSDAGTACAACHGDLRFHGGSRRGGDTCLMCHATSGGEVHYSTILHNFHFETFPVFPNRAGACSKCHGTSEVWNSPTNHDHPTTQARPVRVWTDACTTGCHTATPAPRAHADAMTSPTSGAEACATCHSATSEFPVAVMHMAR